jgi:Zn-dependent M28 family amino/carboxypeptidase
LHRLTAAGQAVRVHLELGAHTAPDAPSANVVGDILGREAPDEVVLLGCHLDSWDVGEGAQDDGAGCAIVLEAARLIGQLDVRPRRTIRVVLFTNEENGLRGAKAYAAAHQADAARLVAAIEADTGAGRPDGFRVQLPLPPAPLPAPSNGAPPTTPPVPDPARPTPAEARVLAALAPVAALLAPINAGGLTLAHAGADVGPLVKHGVLALGLSQDTSGYWPIHHTRADTVDKIDRRALDLDVAAMAVMAYALAELPAPLELGAAPAPAVVPGQ